MNKYEEFRIALEQVISQNLISVTFVSKSALYQSLEENEK